jgi:flagellar motor switch protein FliM
MAAELMIGRMETLIADHLSAALTATAGRAPGMPVPSIVPQRRDGNLAMLAPSPRTRRWPSSRWKSMTAARCPG